MPPRPTPAEEEMIALLRNIDTTLRSISRNVTSTNAKIASIQVMTIMIFVILCSMFGKVVAL